MSHTPGPWHFDVDGGGFYISRPDNELIAVTCNANFDYGATLISEEEEEANARLIAAAPDLLAALMKIVRGFEIDTVTPYHLGEDKPITKADAVKIARAAIAKATNAKG